MSVLQVLFSFQGRISRSEYWLKGFLVLLPFSLLVNFLYFATDSEDAQMFAMVLSFCSYWPALALATKRLHDRDRSAWWILTVLIPFVGIVFVIWGIIEVWFLKGTNGPNRFGDDPVQRHS